MAEGGNFNNPHHNPYKGVGRVLVQTGQTSPDNVFGESALNIKIEDDRPTSQQIYGSNNYVNQNLQGYSVSGNIADTAGQLTSTDSQVVEQLRREQLVSGPNQAQPQIQPQTPNQFSSINANQMYMQAPTVPPINGQPTAQPGSPPRLDTPEGSMDYLDAIAPQTQVSHKLPISNRAFTFAGIGIVALIVIISVVAALSNNGGGIGKRAQVLGKALANLQSIVDYGVDNAEFQSKDMSAITAETGLVMLSHSKELSEHLTFAVDKNGKATDVEADETATEKLNSAKASGDLDSAYYTELKKRLEAISDATVSAYKASKNAKVSSLLNTTHIDIHELLSRLEETKKKNDSSPKDDAEARPDEETNKGQVTDQGNQANQSAAGGQ